MWTKQSDAAAESESNYKSKGVTSPPLGPIGPVRPDRGKGVPSFDEMVAIVLEEVDFDDPTTNVRGRRALAIAKPTSKGLLTTPEHDQPDHEGLFPAGKRRTSKKLRLQSGYCE